MKAIVVREFGPESVLKLETLQDLSPGPGELLVGVEAAGVNPVEAYMRSGAYPAKPALPYTPGNDAAGIVLALGEGVTRFRVGERVYSFGSRSGAYASQMLASESRLQRLPSQISFAQGAALGVPYGTAHRSLFFRAQARPGESVLVQGASGGVGTAAVQLARAAGLQVLATAGTEAGRQAALAGGAHKVFDHSAGDLWEQVMAATGGKGVDIIIEVLANINLGRDLKHLAKFGRVVIVGSRGTVEIDPRDTMGRDANILGMTLANATEQDLHGIHAAIHEGLENGTLRPGIAEELPLAQAPEAHKRVMLGGKVGKIVLLPGVVG
jgi:NADPH2:quinone reductase